MTRQEYVERMSKLFGLPPFALENDVNYTIELCTCGKQHSPPFGKGCPGWRCVPKSAKQLKKDRAELTFEQVQTRSAKVREWRAKHGYQPT